MQLEVGLLFFFKQKAVIENILCCSDLYLSAPFDYFIFLNKVTKEIWLNTQGSVAICIHSTTMLKLFEKWCLFYILYFLIWWTWLILLKSFSFYKFLIKIHLQTIYKSNISTRQNTTNFLCVHFYLFLVCFSKNNIIL